MNPITVNTTVRVASGSRYLGVDKGVLAVVREVKPLGADYSHQCMVTLWFRNGSMAGKVVPFYARHINRLGDVSVSLNKGDPTRKIEIVRAR